MIRAACARLGWLVVIASLIGCCSAYAGTGYSGGGGGSSFSGIAGVDPTPQTLTGTTTASSTHSIDGVGTAFTSEVKAGDLVYVTTTTCATQFPTAISSSLMSMVWSVADDTHLVVSTAIGSGASQTLCKVESPMVVPMVAPVGCGQQDTMRTDANASTTLDVCISSEDCDTPSTCTPSYGFVVNDVVCLETDLATCARVTAVTDAADTITVSSALGSYTSGTEVAIYAKRVAEVQTAFGVTCRGLAWQQKFPLLQSASGSAIQNNATEDCWFESKRVQRSVGILIADINDPPDLILARLGVSGAFPLKTLGVGDALPAGTSIASQRWMGWDGTALSQGAVDGAKTTELWTATSHGAKRRIGRVADGTTTTLFGIELDQDGTVYLGCEDGSGACEAVARKTCLKRGSDGDASACRKAPDALAATYTLTEPVDDGTANQFLCTSDGTGTLAWGCTGGIGATELAATTVVAGSYTATDLTVDADGRIIAASSGAGGAGDITKVGSACTTGDCDSISIADGQKVDLSAVNMSAATEGLFLGQATSCAAAVTEGQVCWDTDDDNLYVGDGAAAKLMNGASTLSFKTIDVPAGTDPVADSATDTLTITTAGICTATGDSSTDTIALACTEVGDISSVGSACTSGACDSISIADGQKIDLSAVNSSATTEGLKLPQKAYPTATTTEDDATAEGQETWLTDLDVNSIGDGALIQYFIPVSRRKLIHQSESWLTGSTCGAATTCTNMGATNMWATTSGTGAQVTYVTNFGSGHIEFGAQGCESGTATNSACSVYMGGGGIRVNQAGLVIRLEGQIALSAGDIASPSAGSYIAYWGFMDVPTGTADPTNGIYFRYDVDTSANWQCVVESTSGGETTADSGIAVDTSTAPNAQVEFMIVVRNTAAADFWIEGAPVCSGIDTTTDRPTGTTPLYAVAARIVKEASSTGSEITMYTEYFNLFVGGTSSARE